MARTTLPTQADEAPTPQPDQSQPQPPQATEAPPPSWWSLPRPQLATIVRMISLAFLVLSISLLASNSTTIRFNDITATYHYNDVYAYRYALATAVIGLSYTFLHLLSSFEQMRTGKVLLVNDPRILLYEFLGDKVVFALVATGVGAAFGATVDLKAATDQIEDAFAIYQDDNITINIFAPIFSKFDDFFNRAYIPAIFLLFALLTTGLSSLLSSLALNNNKN